MSRIEERFARRCQRAVFGAMIAAWMNEPAARELLRQDTVESPDARERRLARNRTRNKQAYWENPTVRDRKKQKYLENRDALRDRIKQKYWANPDRERERVAARKHARPEMRAKTDARRVQRQERLGDGSLTVNAVRALFASARRCPYCLDRFKRSRKSLDHIEPISKGGQHSLRNVVVCCFKCNARKKATSFAEWAAMLNPRHQQRAIAMYVRRFGAAPEQSYIPMEWVLA